MRKRIDRAALELFSKKGFAATGIRELAEAAGISTASLYHYMGTKDDLLERIIIRSMERTLSFGRSITALSEDPAVQLTALVQGHVCLHTTFRHATQVLDHELRSLRKATLSEAVGLRDSYEQIWADILARGTEQGIFELPDQHVSRLALIEMCNGTGTWFNPKGPLGIDEIARITAELSLALARATQDGIPLSMDNLTDPIPFAHIEKLVNASLGDVLG